MHFNEMIEAFLRYVKTKGSEGFARLFDVCHVLAPSEFDREIGRRNAERAGNSRQWLTAEEAAVAEALAKIIIPSEEESPGIDEVCVLGPGAITLLDKMIRKCPDRQRAYSRGLLSFDIWAFKEHGCKFPDLSADQQTNLFRAAQEMNDSLNAGISRLDKVWRRLGALAQIRKGTLYAALLYPRIREDSLKIFYTSRVSWIWLAYDGPPMDKGYVSLSRAR